MYRYGSIPSHPPTCQGGHAQGTCTLPWRDLHETQFACVLHASHAIPRSNHSGNLRRAPPPKRRLSTRPNLGSRPASDHGSARQIQIWHGPGRCSPRGSGERVDVSLSAVGRSTLQSPKLPNALGSTCWWVSTLQVQCCIDPLTLCACSLWLRSHLWQRATFRWSL